MTKDEYANTLRAYQKSKGEMKSEARDKGQTSLNYVKTGFMKGWVTKEEYAQALRAYHDLEMKSEARDKAEDVMAQHLAAS